MLVVISPAKNLDFSPLNQAVGTTQADMLNDSQLLIERCRQLSPADLSALMKISDKLALLNAERFASWQLPFNSDNAKPAAFAFNGDVYAGLQAQSLSDAELQFAQQHLRILSGLYGVLKPLDLIQPYRLEMGTKLDNLHGSDLYQFWGQRITDKLNQAIDQQGDNVVINLASNEYFKAVKPKALNAQIITPVFLDCKRGEYKVISFYAKKARGLMARYIIQHGVTEVAQLHDFDLEGYQFEQKRSNSTQLVYTRAEQ